MLMMLKADVFGHIASIVTARTSVDMRMRRPRSWLALSTLTSRRSNSIASSCMCAASQTTVALSASNGFVLGECTCLLSGSRDMRTCWS